MTVMTVMIVMTVGVAVAIAVASALVLALVEATNNGSLFSGSFGICFLLMSDNIQNEMAQ